MKKCLGAIVLCLLCAGLGGPLALGLPAEETTRGEGGEAVARTRSFFWTDYDVDGLLDVFILVPEEGGRLLRNAGSGQFEEVSWPDVLEEWNFLRAGGARPRGWAADFFLATLPRGNYPLAP